MDNIHKPTASEIEANILLARGYCLEVAKKYWTNIQEKSGVTWPMRHYRGSGIELPSPDKSKADSMARQILRFSPEYAGYELSILYMNLLPQSYREKYGIYYTPINVVELMLKNSSQNNVDLKQSNIIDTTSGGSAFLAPLCRVMAKTGSSDQEIVDDIVNRMTGFEIDPFAAWLSQFLIDCELALIAPKAKQPKRIIHNDNALTMSSSFFGKFDYVIGNPPYKKISKNDLPKGRYDDIVHGAPNLYQLFYKLSFLLARDGGHVHLITPTGFIGGAYFGALRNYITQYATALSFSFFEERSNVFEGVQQELVISLFQKESYKKKTAIYSVSTQKNDQLTVSKIGSINLHAHANWVLPKTKEQLIASEIFGKNSHTLNNIGYQVCTGYVVPHRSKDKLKIRKCTDANPMIWSEAISAEEFKPDVVSSEKHPKWYQSNSKTGLITQPCILIKRTSSKEQFKRIHAAIVDQKYIDRTGGFYVENHINILQQKEHSDIELQTIFKLLQTRIFDQLFRCINGTVTVSSTELNQLPIPSPEALKAFSISIKNCTDAITIEQAAQAAYGLSYDKIRK